MLFRVKKLKIQSIKWETNTKVKYKISLTKTQLN